MDDGSKIGNAYTISTSGFTLEEHELLIECLKMEFGVAATIHGNRYKHLYFPVQESKKFKIVIEPYIVPSMLYKL